MPFAPGGSTDVLARLVADKLKDRLGQPIVIVNRGGANADIGYKVAAAAAPDGHTIVLTVASLVTNPFQLKSALEPSRLAPVIYLAEGPYVLLSSQKFPSTTIQDAIARIRSKPGAVSCGMTGGIGSLACQTLQSFAKSELLQVPYRGVEPATIAIMAGDIDLVFTFGISASRPMEFRPGEGLGDHRAEAWIAAISRICRPSARCCRALRFSAGAGFRFLPERRRTLSLGSIAK